MARREKVRDDRDFDTTSLHAKFHGTNLNRDYSAHFFRWSFARRFITATTNMLEVGCGVDKPLSKILTLNPQRRVNEYLGVDLNPIAPSGIRGLEFRGEFNFVKDWKQLRRSDEGFDLVLHLEVIEHMKVEHGRALLKGCFELLKPGGVMLMSTPCYDGVRHAANHIHEFTVPELARYVGKAGFVVEQRFGTFMDLRHLKSTSAAMKSKQRHFPVDDGQISAVFNALKDYYDNDALSCFFAPLFPDHSRNNLWVCRKPG